MPTYRGYQGRHPSTLALEKGLFSREKLKEAGRDGFWDPLEASFLESFRGLTTDGHVVDGLYALTETGLSIRPIAEAGRAFVSSLSAEQRPHALYRVDDNAWRRWTNAYPIWEPHGLMLESVSAEQRELALAVIEATLSARGFSDVRDAMRCNENLALLTGDVARDDLGEWKYYFALFGSPEDDAWGWQLWGHHIDISCMIVGSQIVLSPVFLGAEPCVIDDGPYAGLRLFQRDAAIGLELARSLDRSQQSTAVLFRSMHSADLPAEYSHPADGRHRAAAGQDNRVYPYEGIRADRLSSGQRELMLQLAECYVGRLGGGHEDLRLAEIERHLDEAHFAFIGTMREGDPFYYKLQSPVFLVEFDHHSGVFLDNPEPEQFHVHTIVRTPNRNDYGFDLLAQHYRRHHHHEPSPLL